MQSETPAPNSVNDNLSGESVATWYNHSNKAYSDSLDFIGLGMALSADSSKAMEISKVQARENLEYAIDSYAEDLRRELSERESNTNFDSGSFILSLRRAVSSLQFSDGDLTTTVEYMEKNNDAVIAYSKISISKDKAIDMLATALKNDTFSRSLRDFSGK